MDKLRHVIESDKGYLKDLEHYSSDPLEAVTFVTSTAATRKLADLQVFLKEDCWVGAVYIPFPHPYPHPL